MDFEGKVIQYLGETGGTSKAGNPWKKKEWLVETFGQFPKKVKLQCFGDRADQMNLENGKDYVFSVDIESREFNGRWYTDVSIFRYAEFQGGQHQSGQYPNQGNYQQPAPQQPFSNMPYNQSNNFGGGTSFSVSVEESDEDLPF